MEAVKIAAVGIVAGLLALSIKKIKPEISMLISIAAGVVIIGMSFGYLTEAVGFIKDFAAQNSEVTKSLMLVLKIVGIAYICEFAVQILKDIGENAVASKIEVGGKLIIMVLTLPMLKTFAETVIGLL